MENLIKDIYYQIKDLVRRIAYLEAHDGVSDLSSAMSFVQLTDTPNDYVGDGGKVVVVNAAETGLEFQEAAGAGPFDVDLPPNTPSTYDDEFNDESLDPAWTERDVLNSVTVSEEGETLVLTCTGGTHAEHYHHHIFGVGKTPPSGSYQAVVRVRVTDTLTDGCGIGVGLKFPTAEKYIYVHAFSNPDGGTQTTIYYKAYFGSGGGEGTIATYAETNPWVYLRLRYNDTVTTLWIDSSLDGLTWSSSPGYDLSTAGESPNEILVSIGGSTQNGDVGVCDFFRVREVAGNASDPVYGDYGALEAGQVSYTPTTPADWTDPDPATVQDALDTLAGLDDNDARAIHDDQAGEIAALTEKTTPVSADLLIIEDSGASYAKKKVQIGNLPDGGGGSAAFSGAKLGREQAFSLPPGATSIVWDWAYFDTDDYSDLTNHPTRLTIPTDGYYHIKFMVEISDPADTSGFMTAAVVFTSESDNGQIKGKVYSDENASDGPNIQGSGIAYLSGGDYIVLQVTHNNASDNGLPGGPSSFEIQYLGA